MDHGICGCACAGGACGPLPACGSRGCRWLNFKADDPEKEFWVAFRKQPKEEDKRAERGWASPCMHQRLLTSGEEFQAQRHLETALNWDLGRRKIKENTWHGDVVGCDNGHDHDGD